MVGTTCKININFNIIHLISIPVSYALNIDPGKFLKKRREKIILVTQYFFINNALVPPYLGSGLDNTQLRNRKHKNKKEYKRN